MQNSLFEQKQFPVPLRREFCSNTLLSKSHRFSVLGSRFREIPCFFPDNRESRFKDGFADDWVVSHIKLHLWFQAAHLMAEGARDKIAASKSKGLWVGGPIPLDPCRTISDVSGPTYSVLGAVCPRRDICAEQRALATACRCRHQHARRGPWIEQPDSNLLPIGQSKGKRRPISW